MVKAIEWIASSPAHIRLIDQTKLPLETSYLTITEVAQLIEAIQVLAVRGAPALGAAGALGVVVAMDEAERKGWSDAAFQEALDAIRDARPTAVNLGWAVEKIRVHVPEGREVVLQAALQLMEDDTAANKQLARLGADWVQQHVQREKIRFITHCNTGALATTGWGTAYGIIHELHERGAIELVYADETRPLLQGSRLTSWELQQDGIPHVVQADGAAASTILRGLVDVAVIGADRIANNGDSANKIGSVGLALACQRAGIPFIVAAPYSTVDTSLPSGNDIVIEERNQDEVLHFGSERTSPPGVAGFNPAFDVTPHDLISAVVTELGIVEPAISPDPRLLETLISS